MLPMSSEYQLSDVVTTGHQGTEQLSHTTAPQTTEEGKTVECPSVFRTLTGSRTFCQPESQDII
jgi:hypothetical protein